MAKRNYDEEFKRDAVELLLSGAKELKPLARDLGVCPTTLRRWRDRCLREREPSQGLPQSLILGWIGLALFRQIVLEKS